ncbi:hypothetical protein VTJ49DRAFT_3467 [Mycothermus thermophilus]|uniref:DUF726-domain-containing protein n=1 Tax=Humicola insolens TaxID=85995 RepID=A0ABR3VMI5_HUMIN
MSSSKEVEASSSKSLDTNGPDSTSPALEATAPEAVTGDQTSVDDDTAATAAAEMPPNGRQRPGPIRREADLSSILGPADKPEVTALVTAVTNSMLQRIIHLFDPANGDPDAPNPRVSYWSKLPHHLKDLSLNDPAAAGGAQASRISNIWENVKPARPKKAGRARDKRDAVRRDNADTPGQMDAAAAPAEPAAPPRLQELKKEALLHFRKWQGAVHRRINEISAKKPLDHRPLAPGHPAQRGGRRPSSNRRGRQASSRAQYQYDNWVSPTTAGRTSGPSMWMMPTESSLTLAADPLLTQLFPPLPTPLASWPTERRCLLFHALFLMMLSIENYSAYTRVLLLNIASALRLPMHVLTDDEDRMSAALAQIAKDIPPDLLVPKKTEDGKPIRGKWKGLPGTGPVALSKIAAALDSARIGSVFGIRGIPSNVATSLLGILAENSLATAAIFGMCGVRNSSRMMEHYLRDVVDFAFRPLRGALDEQIELGKIAPESRRLRIVLGIGGWLMNRNDTTSPWHCLGPQNEVYAVQWELDTLTKLGASFDTLVRSAAWSAAKKEIVARTSKPTLHPASSSGVSAANNKPASPVFTNLAERRWPSGLIKISKIIDNNWNNGMVRADKLGAVLADVLISKAQGERGVSLIGYSLGARAIYACLMCLAEKRAFGLVENAVLMGCPAPSEPLAWCAMKSVVAGRLVNVYSENDYILGFLYRTSSIDFGLAGLQRVVGVGGVENVDVTAKVSVHLRYRYLAGSILQHIGWEDMVPEQIARHEADMSCYEDRNRKHEERRDAIEMGWLEQVKREDQQGVIRTRMRKKGKK